MTDQQRNVDALLAVSASRMLLCGEMVQQMRGLHRDNADERYWRLAQQLADHLTVAGHCLMESNRILLAQKTGPSQGHTLAGVCGGGLVN
jgi:hypothetical protein